MGHRPEQPRVHPDASIEQVSDLDLPVRAESPVPQGRDMSPLKRCLLLLNVALKDVAKPRRLRNSIRFRPLQRSLFGLPFGESGRGIYIKYIIGSSAFHWFLLYLNKALMRKTGIGLLVAAYVSALCTWLAAPAYARANAQAGLPILVVASALTLDGLVLALIPIRRGEKWAIWLSAVNLLILLTTRIATDPTCLVVLDPHQQGGRTFMVSMALGLVSLALAAPRRFKSGHSGAVQSTRYRKENRLPQTVRLQLSSTTDVLAPESAFTENVSSHGMRVRTVRFWEPGTEALIKSPIRELWAGARIVYCHSLSYNSFALGLELLTAAQKDKI